MSNAEAFGRVLALDALLHNEDRHAGNMLLQAQDEFHVRAWAIDCDHALVGWPPDFAALPHDAIPSLRNLAPNLPVDLLAAGARAGALAATSIPPDTVISYANEACDITGDPNRVLLAHALLARMVRAVELTDEYLEVIGAMS